MKHLNYILKFLLSNCILLFAIFACNQTQSNQENNEKVVKGDTSIIVNPKGTNYALESLWVTPADLKTPESVCYNKKQDVFYVANINGQPTDKDNNGFISKLSPQGEIIELKWVTGLNAPKGMGIANGKLFVTDIDRVVEIDISKATITNTYPVKNAEFLNDIAVQQQDNNFSIFISDSNAGILYRFSNGSIEKWISDDQLNNPNGLFVNGDNLLTGVRNRVLKINIANKNISTFIQNTGGIDGLAPAVNGYYLTTDWKGTTQLVHPDKEKIQLLNTADENINAADFEYLPEKKMILIPTFYDNRVMAYKLIK